MNLLYNLINVWFYVIKCSIDTEKSPTSGRPMKHGSGRTVFERHLIKLRRNTTVVSTRLHSVPAQLINSLLWRNTKTCTSNQLIKAYLHVHETCITNNNKFSTHINRLVYWVVFCVSYVFIQLFTLFRIRFLSGDK